VLDYIEDQQLMHNAAEVGAYLRGKLEELMEKHPVIGEVRGMGLMQGIEIVEDRKSKTPATPLTLALLEAAREHRILLGRGGLYGNVLRITPPLNISKTDVDEFVTQLDASFVHSQAAAMVG
jgi:4-aminobutyrate aminotransferase-like enzyme